MASSQGVADFDLYPPSQPKKVRRFTAPPALALPSAFRRPAEAGGATA
jgi:hypothetical protein